jgi:hypothetical protein
MKLELKHLAPYLPYGLQLQLHGDFPIREGEKNIIHKIYEMKPSHIPKALEWETIKPILRPLSDLTKEYPINNIKEGGFLDAEDVDYIQQKPRGHYKLYQAMYLFGHHFDVFGLIEAGLAIDINTIEL